jgi:hypothetical protein
MMALFKQGANCPPFGYSGLKPDAVHWTPGGTAEGTEFQTRQAKQK